jgi:hypothetical protein
MISGLGSIPLDSSDTDASNNARTYGSNNEKKEKKKGMVS